MSTGHVLTIGGLPGRGLLSLTAQNVRLCLSYVRMSHQIAGG
ncbi:hypothetical protein HanRHA438_Chr07g0300741 [Helianthus annuus]|uniref:Uncharacterized protein n=1 Tax=Helianthus annuus TaxID=4232 RepID=A0A9K3NF55_HELAN|nr:hypothetical protein HanXRQr2_Chr07g0290241 [Helianthus annuus]KAJ0549848.1 hypothetical protein HanHA300_Chr07g0238651 [Helianthus annuus]KAJ0556377.1 hypothetical protein HanIR_Chr07g0313091 [Helianthus annuus]KAJ0741385.1 hypothetical protein HanOQP8_Chr06g0227471 [Helianthus annuus]KAJ0904339.1 hypothetical protein HanPSC8_Chr07g0280971 [Helianthus annuus]